MIKALALLPLLAGLAFAQAGLSQGEKDRDASAGGGGAGAAGGGLMGGDAPSPKSAVDGKVWCSYRSALWGTLRNSVYTFQSGEQKNPRLASIRFKAERGLNPRTNHFSFNTSGGPGGGQCEATQWISKTPGGPPLSALCGWSDPKMKSINLIHTIQASIGAPMPTARQTTAQQEKRRCVLAPGEEYYWNVEAHDLVPGGRCGPYLDVIGSGTTIPAQSSDAPHPPCGPIRGPIGGDPARD